MSRQKKKTPVPSRAGGFSEKKILAEGPARELSLLNQAMPIISERIGNDKTAHKLVGAAEKALGALRRLKEEPELLDHYALAVTGEDLDAHFEAVLVLSHALTSKIGTEKAVKGLEKALMNDDETIRHVALEGLVEHYWVSANFRDVDLLMKIPQLRETVAACLWSAYIRLDDSGVSLESRRYLRAMMLEQAKTGNMTAKMFLDDVRRMAGID